MNPQQAKDYLQSRLPAMVVEVIENYSNQYTTGATRFIFEKDGKKANLMFNKSVKLDTEGLDGIIDAILKKFSEAPVEPAPVVEQAKTPASEIPEEAYSQSNISYELYTAAKKVVETYEKENPMT